MALIECVPNFSEGRNSLVITKIQEAIKKVTNVVLLHVDSGFSAHRTVMTFVGSPEAVIEAAFQSIKKAADLIDMNAHEGTHPCMGATDVCPIIPVSGITMQEAVEWSNKLGERVAKELNIPVYLYENAARFQNRRNLALIRRGGYKKLSIKLQDPNWKPDYGQPPFHGTAGATIIGARDFLLAYNVNLNTDKVSVAKTIASQIRTNGNAKARPNLKAIGWLYKEKNIAQVSMNLTDYRKTGLHHAYEAVKKAAQEQGFRVTGSELIGLAPLQCLKEAGYFYVNNRNKYRENQQNDATLIAEAIKSLGLNKLIPFNPQEKILEYSMNNKGVTE